MMTDYLTEARAALARRDWREGYAAYVRADGIGSMTLDDLDAYAGMAWRLGHGREAVRLAERVYHQLVRTDPTAAAMKAVDLTVVWRTRGHHTVADDWAAKAGRLLAGTSVSTAHGYLAYAEVVAAIDRDDADALARGKRTLDEVGRRVEDPALSVLARVIEGVAAVLDGRDGEGLRALDAVLLPVLDPRVPLEWGGDAYRLALRVVERRGDDDHVRAFVDAMQRWCEAFDAAAYRAICDVHRLRADTVTATPTARATELQRAVVDVDAVAMAILEELLAGGAR
ncbi:MAG: hypothetical protein NVSMB60_22010 [Mycobacterium sp.]